MFHHRIHIAHNTIHMILILKLECSHNTPLQFGMDSVWYAIIHAIMVYHFVWRTWNREFRGSSSWNVGIHSSIDWACNCNRIETPATPSCRLHSQSRGTVSSCTVFRHVIQWNAWDRTLSHRSMLQLVDHLGWAKPQNSPHSIDQSIQCRIAP